MDLERIRAIAASLPHVAETVQWGSNLVLWVGDKSVGGKMFALFNLEPDRLVGSFAAGPEGYAELTEREGIVPAPYLARAHWVAVERWSDLGDAEWRQRITNAHTIVMQRLTKKARAALEAKPVRGATKARRQRALPGTH